MKKIVNGIKIDMTLDEIEEFEAQQAAFSEHYAAVDARTERDTKLTESDWTQVVDAPVDQAAWATYRQALRDIPEQSGFPNEVNWPTEP